MPWSEWQDPWVMTFTVEADSIEDSARLVTAGPTGGGDTAAQMSTVQASLKVAGGTSSSPTFGAQFTATASEAIGSARADSQHGYAAANYLGSVHGNDLDAGLPPGFPSSSDIPPGEQGPNTLYDVIDYESGSTTFDGWDDTVFPHVAVLTFFNASDGVAHTRSGWTPPTSAAFAVGVCAPVASGASLVYSDLDVLDTFDMATVSSGPLAPYTGTSPLTADFEVTDTQDVDIALSATSLRDLAVVLMSTFAGPDTFTVPTFTEKSMSMSLSLGQSTPGVFASGFLSFTPRPTIKYTSPRWRYWIDDGPLRTIGDHFRSVGGADVKSLIPGVGWVKVRRGT